MNIKPGHSSVEDLPHKSQILHIGVMMLAEIGDILVTTPAIAALRERYPDARITAIVRAPFADLLIDNPCVDSLLLLNKKNLLTKVNFLVRLFFRSFDLFVDLHTPTFNTCTDNEDVFRRNYNVMRFTRAVYRLGYASVHTSKLLTHSVAIPTNEQLSKENIVDTTLRIVGRDGRKQYKKVLVINSDVGQWADELLSSRMNNDKFVVFFFGSKQSADVWPFNKVAAFINEFLSRYQDYHLLIIGGEFEKQTAKKLMESTSPLLQKRLVNLVGLTSLQQTAACIKKCSCMISTDSGPLHMADALQVPIVALFSSKNYPSIWRPMHSRTALLNRPVSCGPCFKETCDKNNECMEKISVEDVTKAVSTFLDAAI
jgi:ADP-heptose:LPS heptosyltransferase